MFPTPQTKTKSARILAYHQRILFIIFLFRKLSNAKSFMTLTQTDKYSSIFVRVIKGREKASHSKDYKYKDFVQRL